jgi:hypothetical protein
LDDSTRCGDGFHFHFDDTDNEPRQTYPSGDLGWVPGALELEFSAELATGASGDIVARGFDPLDRLQTLTQASGPAQGTQIANFGFRGPDLLATTSLSNSLSGKRQFDAAKRRIDDWFQVGAQSGTPQTVFRESLAWSPRNLKSGAARPDLG